MSTDLFNAILAMDSYNRGYGEGIKDLGNIGNVTVLAQSDTREGTPGVAAGFYAIAYQGVDGSVTISYRGTDDVNSISDIFTSDDIWHGWTIGGGIQDTDQAELAFQFYNTVAGQGANISLTGHSLGGGLAGLVGMVNQKVFTAFDNMPFVDAANDDKRQGGDCKRIAA